MDFQDTAIRSPGLSTLQIGSKTWLRTTALDWDTVKSIRKFSDYIELYLIPHPLSLLPYPSRVCTAVYTHSVIYSHPDNSEDVDKF